MARSLGPIHPDEETSRMTGVEILPGIVVIPMRAKNGIRVTLGVCGSIDSLTRA